MTTRAQRALPLPEMYYQDTNKDYYVENDRGLWIRINENSTKRHLKAQGFSSTVAEGEAVSPLDRCISEIQLQHSISYAASLAGYNAGLYDVNNRRILVTDSPRFIDPVEGEWPLLAGILEGMFADPTHDQRPYVFGWLKIGITGLRSGNWQPGQVLTTAGPVRAAKSLFQAIVTRLLGGRAAHPYLYMTGGTTFNADLFAAEHLMIEDVAESTDIRTRRHFGANIKSFAVNRDQHCHGKQLQALTLTPFWRVTISLNDDPERLLVLPPIDEDIADKIMLLNVRRRDMPMPTTTPDEVAAFWRALEAELPAFVHFLQNFEIPVELRSPRFGIIHYHHPDLVAGLNVLAPEVQLLELIDEEIFDPARSKKDAWTGLAVTLQGRLTSENSDCRRQAEKLLQSPVACGTYLSRLETKRADRVRSRRIHGRTEYTIQPPQRD